MNNKLTKKQEEISTFIKGEKLDLQITVDGFIPLLNAFDKYAQQQGKNTVDLGDVSYSEAELNAKLDEQKEEIRQWLIDEDFEGLAERI